MIECVPIDDLEPHGRGIECKCCPEVVFGDGEMIVVHMAFDGRHLIEQVNDMLNNEQTGKKWKII